jgi:glycosyltransferase involved in cell wall biosynthesis
MVSIFIISFNRLTVLKALVDRLDCLRNKRIIVVDNNSDYPPLLSYYRDLPRNGVEVLYMGRNYGHDVVGQIFDEHQYRVKYQMDECHYAYTDCDIVPDFDSPNDYLEKFSAVLDRYPRILKVGFGLRIDDLPDTFKKKRALVEWENQFWKDPIHDEVVGLDLYPAPIDSTFACQRADTRPGYSFILKSFRTGPPYVARHLPWYIDSENLSEEDQNYMSTALEAETHFPGRYGKEPE